jgi:glucoamylase
MPLMWAHAEYVKLLRSIHDGRVFDRIDVVAARYCGVGAIKRKLIEIWKFNRQPRSFRPDKMLRIQLGAAFHLVWTANDCQTSQKLESQSPTEGIHFIDLPSVTPGSRIEFTFWWCNARKWEGQNFAIESRVTCNETLGTTS